jgi:hypothetical protein
MKHKQMSQVELIQSVRKQWDFNPAPRIVKSKKQYNRRSKFVNSED